MRGTICSDVQGAQTEHTSEQIFPIWTELSVNKSLNAYLPL